MKYGSLFSGVEAAAVAWRPLSWECQWVAEIDAFASAVLDHHYPDVPNLGDVNGIDTDAIEPVDLIVFGSPCQSFSVAGKRLGLDDPRGNMALVGLRVVGRVRPRWMVWENVPGVLSSDEGRDFGTFLGLLGELGYGFAYRVLDAQHFGVPQRRRRVFVVGHLGDWRPAAAVLFEPESLRGDTPPRREAGERVAASLTRGVDSGGKGGYAGRRREDDTNIIASCVTTREDSLDFESSNIIAQTVTSKWAKGSGGPAGSECGNLVTHSLRADGFDASEDGTGRGTPLIAFGGQMSTPHWQFDQSDTLQAKNPKALSCGMTVRRLTPRECERLQGFPDDYTLVPYRGKPAADGPRYRAIGNSFAVPVVRWIGGRIAAVSEATAAIGRSGL